MLDVTRYLASAARRTRSVDAAAESLRKLRERIGPAEVGKPERLVVLNNTGYAYERTDGVTVAPITSLGLQRGGALPAHL